MVGDRVSVKEGKDILFVVINGDLEITTIKKVESELLGYATPVEKNIEIDFTHVNYMDSSGVGLLIKLSKLLKSKGKNLRLINLPEKISQILKLSSLYEDLEGHDIEIF